MHLCNYMTTQKIQKVIFQIVTIFCMLRAEGEEESNSNNKMTVDVVSFSLISLVRKKTPNDDPCYIQNTRVYKTLLPYLILISVQF